MEAVSSNGRFHDEEIVNSMGCSPNELQIQQPQEEYSITLEETKLTISGPIVDDQLVLERPSGAGLASQ